MRTRHFAIRMINNYLLCLWNSNVYTQYNSIYSIFEQVESSNNSANVFCVWFQRFHIKMYTYSYVCVHIIEINSNQMCVSVICSHLLGICSTIAHIFVHICTFVYSYACTRCVHARNVWVKFSHKTGRNVDNYFHFRREGYFYLLQNQILAIVLHFVRHELKS